ncbi:hypothetical protein L0P88_03240 [Muricauda sp. SCSIO 64092]|uniref:lanthionine synthetase LanC family protein n=1 Tax=Allomuricauda sp. SCSIO 64092 TaxID=2908842 RepID=UPI001FF166D0|nr:lanthionine synthetase LanC family protein [Muricauda sp. SCSIO 64092]UOY07575.1 hypothetical protein L0P88_03240 [Muricauda sp. SCSIO 64092]
MNNQHLKSKLQEINSVISKEYKSIDQIGVLSGLSGVALFSYHYSRYILNRVENKVGEDIIELIINKINDGYQYPTFCTGLAGFGWMIDNLQNEGFIDLPTDELLSQFDLYLYEMMILDIKSGNYDFLHGAIGYSIYFLSRYKSTKKNREAFIGSAPTIYLWSPMPLAEG